VSAPREEGAGGGGNRRTPAPFVVGAARSGTTLLRLMLDAHPELAIPPETQFVPDLIKACRAEDCTPERALEIIVSRREWEDFGLEPDELLTRLGRPDKLTAGKAVRAFYRLYARKQGKPRWGDKTPQYVQRMLLIQGALREARFVHVIRDGRDVTLSRQERGVRAADAEKVATRWRELISRARGQSDRIRHYLEVRYEDLVSDPDPTLRRVCEFIELDFDPAMLAHHESAGERLGEMAHDLPAEGQRPQETAEDRLAMHARAAEAPDRGRVQRWRREMDPADVERFESVAGDLLAELGYEVESAGAGGRRA
jgi:hypothetical protein